MSLTELRLTRQHQHKVPIYEIEVDRQKAPELLTRDG